MELSDNLVTCPYDVSHQIRRSKMAMHMLRCSKNYPEIILKKCPHNASHQYRQCDFDAHVRSCPDKIYEEREMKFKEQLERYPPVQSTFDNFGNEDGDWDNDVPVYNFSAQETIFYKNIARNPPNSLSTVRRKAWRRSENERLRRLEDAECILDIEFPDKTGGFETIATMIQHLGLSRGGASLVVPRRNVNNFMSTAEPMTEKYLPVESINSASVNKQEGACALPIQIPKKEIKLEHVSSGFKCPLPNPAASRPERLRGYGRGSKIGTDKNKEVGGLKEINKQ